MGCVRTGSSHVGSAIRADLNCCSCSRSRCSAFLGRSVWWREVSDMFNGGVRQRMRCDASMSRCDRLGGRYCVCVLGACQHEIDAGEDQTGTCPSPRTESFLEEPCG